MAYNLTPAPVNVWDFNPPQSLADKVFATTSVSGIEFSDDPEPVLYHANRALLSANAAQELNELQERNHATTAYSTLGCVATPLFPTFDAQRAVICAQDKAADMGGMCNPPGTVARASGEPPIGYPSNLPSSGAMGMPGYYRQGSRAHVQQKKVSPQHYPDRHANMTMTMNDGGPPLHHPAPDRHSSMTVPPSVAPPQQPLVASVSHITDPSDVVYNSGGDGQGQEKKNKKTKKNDKFVNSLRGALYDLKHWDQLPGKTATDNWKFVCGRDDRGSYLLLFVTIIFFLIAILAVAISSAVSKSRNNQQQALMLAAISRSRQMAARPLQPYYTPYPPQTGLAGGGGAGGGGGGRTMLSAPYGGRWGF